MQLNGSFWLAQTWHAAAGTAAISAIVSTSGMPSQSVMNSRDVGCRELDLSGNLLESLGPGLSQMPALQLLLLDHNRLESLPDSLASCPALLKAPAGSS